MIVNQKVMDLLKEQSNLLTEQKSNILSTFNEMGDDSIIIQKCDDIERKLQRCIDINKEIRLILNDEAYTLHLQLHKALCKEYFTKAESIKKEIEKL